MTKKWRRKYCWKISFFHLSLGLHKGRPSYRRSFQPSKENIQHFKKWTFKLFSLFVGHFCPPGSGSGYGSRDPVESGSGYGSRDPVESGSTNWIVRYSAYLSFSPYTAKYIGSWQPAPNFHIPCSVTWSDRPGNVWVVISWHWATPATDSPPPTSIYTLPSYCPHIFYMEFLAYRIYPWRSLITMSWVPFAINTFY